VEGRGGEKKHRSVPEATKGKYEVPVDEEGKDQKSKRMKVKRNCDNNQPVTSIPSISSFGPLK
jgi:hypothetical protein